VRTRASKRRTSPSIAARAVATSAGAAKLRASTSLSFGTARAEGSDLAGSAAAIREAVQSVAVAATHLAALGKQQPAATLVQAVPFQRMFGLVLLALEALDQAVVARRLRGESGDQPRLVAKQRNLEFFTATMLPQALALGRSILMGDESCLDPELFTF